MTNFNASTSDSLNISNINTLLQEQHGLYSLAKPLTVKDFVRCAKHLIACQYKYTDSTAMTSAQKSKDYLITALSLYEEEKFAVLFLDNHRHVIAFEILFHGTVNGAAVYSRVLMKRVLAHNAAAVILAHNHPSGNPTASLTDIRLTQKLKELLKLLDVEVLDHIIVGGVNAESLAELDKM